MTTAHGTEPQSILRRGWLLHDVIDVSRAVSHLICCYQSRTAFSGDPWSFSNPVVRQHISNMALVKDKLKLGAHRCWAWEWQVSQVGTPASPRFLRSSINNRSSDLDSCLHFIIRQHLKYLHTVHYMPYLYTEARHWNTRDICNGDFIPGLFFKL